MTTTEASARTGKQHPSHSKRPMSQLPGPSWYTAAGNTFRFLRHALDFSQEMRDCSEMSSPSRR